MKKIRFLGLSLVFLSSLLAGCGQFKGLAPTIETVMPSQPVSPLPDKEPEVILERNDWSTIWIEEANQTSLPRILLVGDSITEGYYNEIKKKLEDNYYLGRYTTSKFVANPDFSAELSILLNRYQFEIILLNNGLHGWDYPLDSYRFGLEELISLLKEAAPDAIIIWCQTTPVRLKEDLSQLGPLNQQVIARNQVASDLMEREGIPVINLYKPMLGHADFYRTDGFHFNDQGQAFQAEIIANFILEAR